MRFRTILILAALILVGVFALVNWQAITAPTSLNFVVARVEAPLGLLMLAAIGMLSVFFLLVLARSEIAMLIDGRRIAKELESARRIAAEAEASRVESLRAAVLNELAEINRKLDAMPGRSGGGAGLSQAGDRS